MKIFTYNEHFSAKQKSFRTLLPLRSILTVFAALLLFSSLLQAQSGSGEITGTVTEARYGKALIGALVKIKETGAQVFTDDDGQYDLTKLPAGSYTLEVQFFGFDNQQANIRVVAGEAVSLDFAMVNDQLDPLTVYGQRSAISQAHSEQRAAANVSTVISESFLGNVTGSTVPEVLKSVPGITFTRDRRTGDGSQITVRGLAPEYNIIKMNGLVLSGGSGLSRAPQLDGILADSISKITIHKSLLPSHESNGTGGLVEIETKSPLDRKDGYMAFNIEGHRKGDNFGDGYMGSGTISKIFGNEKPFGLSASLQIQKRDTVTHEVNTYIDFRYLPTFADGTLISSSRQMDPARQFPWEDFDGADSSSIRGVIYYNEQVSIDNTVATISGAWQPAYHTDLRFDYMHTEKKTESFSSENAFSMSGRHTKLPVTALGGEERYTYLYGYISGNLNSTLYNEDESVDSLSFQGNTERGAWEFDYQLGHVRSKSITPRVEFEGGMRVPLNSDNLIWLAPEAFDANGNLTQAWTENDDFPIPQLSEHGFNSLLDPSLYAMDEFFDWNTHGKDERTTGLFSSRYNVDGDHIKYVEFGTRYEDSNGTSFAEAGEVGGNWVDVRGVTFADVGVVVSPTDFSDIGQGFPILPALTRETMSDFGDRAQGLFNDGFLREGRGFFSISSQSHQEKDLSAYLQSEINFGKFQFIGGLRYNKVTTSATTWRSLRLYRDIDGNRLDREAGFPESLVQVTTSATVSDVLPRMLLNYRHSDNTILRAGYYTTVTRPRLSHLSSRTTISVDLLPSRRRVEVATGNPGLEPSYTDNYDLTFEYYMGDIGIIKLGGFYKQVNDHLENTVTGLIQSKELAIAAFPDHPLYDALSDPVNADLEYRFTRRENGGSGTIWGIEAEYITQFDRLPGRWAGLGLLANYTYTDSSLDRKFVFQARDGSDVDRPYTAPFSGDPNRSGALGLSYNMAGIDASLIYTTQDRHIRTFRPFGQHWGNEKFDSLDFKIAYLREVGNVTYQVYFEGLDLLKGTNDPGTETILGGFGSVPRERVGARYYGGRSFILGLRAKF